MSNDVVMVAIPKELRDKLMRWFGDWSYWTNQPFYEALRAAPETVSLEGVERYDLHLYEHEDGGGIIKSKDGFFTKFSDVENRVIGLQESIIEKVDSDTIIINGERFKTTDLVGWCGTPAEAIKEYESHAQLMDACHYRASHTLLNRLIRILAQSDLRRLVTRAQPSVVVSRGSFTMDNIVYHLEGKINVAMALMAHQRNPNYQVFKVMPFGQQDIGCHHSRIVEDGDEFYTAPPATF